MQLQPINQWLLWPNRSQQFQLRTTGVQLGRGHATMLPLPAVPSDGQAVLKPLQL